MNGLLKEMAQLKAQNAEQKDGIDTLENMVDE